MHNKMPTEGNLRDKGSIVVSVCFLCGKAAESTNHRFLSCSQAKSLWCWFSSMLNLYVDTLSFHSILSICNKDWSSQGLDVVIAGIINILCTIWYSRNQYQFNNKSITVQFAKKLILSNVRLFGNTSSGFMSSSVAEFVILKGFWVNGHPCKAPRIKQVTWYPPICNMVK